jgi:hypothetical protein
VALHCSSSLHRVAVSVTASNSLPNTVNVSFDVSPSICLYHSTARERMELRLRRLVASQSTGGAMPRHTHPHVSARPLTRASAVTRTHAAGAHITV